jgi:hypothetical protein
MGEAPGESAPGGDEARPSYDHVPMVEIEAVHQIGPVPQGEPYRTLEVWTQNRVYKMSPAMVCVEVRERAAGALVPDSEFLGQRLVGGQRREGATIELSHPFPRPGAEAVFEKLEGGSGALSRTSAVSRVVLRLHVVTVDSRGVAPTWAQLKQASIAPPSSRTGE